MNKIGLFLITLFLFTGCDLGPSKQEIEVDRQWKERFPAAPGTHHIYCNELGFLTEAYNLHFIINVSLIRADNGVPVRCHTDHHETHENTGSLYSSKRD